MAKHFVLLAYVLAAVSVCSFGDGHMTQGQNITVKHRGGGCRFLYVIGQLGLGGAERQLFYLLSSLDRSLYPSHLVVWNYNPYEKYSRDIEALNIPLYGLPAEWSSFAKLRALRRLAQELTPEVIHSYVFFTNFAAYYAARGAGAIAIGSLRSDIIRSIQSGGIWRGTLNRIWPHCRISNSVVCAHVAQKKYSSFFPPPKYFVVRNGLDLNSFRPLEVACERNTYVASVGSLLPVKRWDRLVKAVQKIVSLGIKDAHFCLAGDGPSRAALQQLAEELGISHAIKFLGAVHDIPEFLQGAKFLVHTSDSEGCPNAVMEAMATGRAIVATDAGDVPYLIEDGKTGFVVRRNDDESLVNRIAILLNNPDLCRQMGEAARARAERDFGLSAFVEKTLEAYRVSGWKEKS